MSAAKKKRSNRPLILGLVFIAIVALGVWVLFGPNIGRQRYLYIHTGWGYDQVLATLKDSGYVHDATSFDILAKSAGLPAHIRPGRYQLSRGMSNFAIVRLLRRGTQAPVKLVINKLRTKKDLVALLSANLEADSAELAHMLQDSAYLSQFGLDTNTAMCAIIPDTYEFFWNTPADNVFKKMQKNYARFWSDDRRQKARAHGLTPVKATIVASIVDEETNRADDKLNIASVYLNRLEKGMKLQADPTVKFAIGDFAIRRITGAMLQYQSPYNTYQNEGLPPGPICTPSMASIDAVLNSPKTTYIYFCAKADLRGASVFASTGDEHIKNAHAYQQALNARGIH